jgi:CheY-like chemotaxis protein
MFAPTARSVGEFMKNAKWGDESVLVVDDDACVREGLCELLNLKGYSVLEAENGQQALEVLKTTLHFPCLVVLDLRMPVLDGRGFLTIRARDPILREIPVVVVSGSPQDGSRLEGIEAYLRKPVDFSDLVRLIPRHN